MAQWAKASIIRYSHGYHLPAPRLEWVTQLVCLLHVCRLLLGSVALSSHCQQRGSKQCAWWKKKNDTGSQGNQCLIMRQKAETINSLCRPEKVHHFGFWVSIYAFSCIQSLPHVVQPPLCSSVGYQEWSMSSYKGRMSCKRNQIERSYKSRFPPENWAQKIKYKSIAKITTEC
jgi:hypothetical protein